MAKPIKGSETIKNTTKTAAELRKEEQDRKAKEKAAAEKAAANKQAVKERQIEEQMAPSVQHGGGGGSFEAPTVSPAPTQQKFNGTDATDYQTPVTKKDVVKEKQLAQVEPVGKKAEKVVKSAGTATTVNSKKEAKIDAATPAPVVSLPRGMTNRANSTLPLTTDETIYEMDGKQFTLNDLRRQGYTEDQIKKFKAYMDQKAAAQKAYFSASYLSPDALRHKYNETEEKIVSGNFADKDDERIARNMYSNLRDSYMETLLTDEDALRREYDDTQAKLRKLEQAQTPTKSIYNPTDASDTGKSTLPSARETAMALYEQKLAQLRQVKNASDAARVVSKAHRNGDDELLQNLVSLYTSQSGSTLNNALAAFGGGLLPGTSGEGESRNAIKQYQDEAKRKGYSDKEIALYAQYLQNEKYQDTFGPYIKWVQDHTILGAAAAGAAQALTSPARGFSRILSGAASAEFGGKAADPAKMLTDAVKQGTQEAVQNILEAHTGADGKPTFLGKATAQVYQWTTSAAESVFDMVTLGPATSVFMGMNAAADAYDEALEKGMDKKQAVSLGITAGVFEALFEYLSLEKIKVFNSTKLTGKAGWAAMLAKSSVVEGTEEAFTDIANLCADFLLAGGMSEYNQAMTQGLTPGQFAGQKAWDIFLDALGGTFSGGLLGATSQIKQHGFNARSQRKTGKTVLQEGDVNALIEQGLSSDDEKIVNLSKKMQQQAKDGNVSNREAGQLYNALQAEDVKAAVKQEAIKRGASEKSAEAIGNGIASQLTGQIIEPASQSALETEIGQQIRSEVIDGAEWTQDVTGKFADRAITGGMQTDKGAIALRNDERINKTVAQVRSAIENGKTYTLVKNGYEGRLGGENVASVKIGGIVGVRNGKLEMSVDYDEKTGTHATALFDTNGGQDTVASTDQTFNDLLTMLQDAVNGDLQSDLQETKAGEKLNTGIQMTVDAANAAIANFDERVNTDTDSYVRWVYDAYKAGATGVGFEKYFDLLRQGNDAARGNALTLTQLRAAWRMGAAAFDPKEGLTRIGSAALSNERATQLVMADRAAKETGRKILIVDKMTEDNGFYKHGSGLIVAALNSDYDLVLRTVFEEAYHQVKDELGETEGLDFVDTTLDMFKADRGEAAMQAALDQVSKLYFGASYSELVNDNETGSEKIETVHEEVAAQYFAGLKTRAELQDYSKAFEGKKNLLQKLADAIRKVLDIIRRNFDKMAGNDVIVQSARDTTEATLEKVLALVNDAIEKTRETRAQEIAERGEQIRKEAWEGAVVEQNGDVRMESKRVTDRQTLDFLNEQIENGEYVTTYKAMQLVDGKLHSPMAALINGKYENEYELGQWYQATENPPKFDKSGKPVFDLNKGRDESGKALGTITARYNPYEHSSNYVINDQFTSAYKRDNLVVVEMRIPNSELTSGYKAEYAKDAVGWQNWKTGPVGGELAKQGKVRKVLLSRWAMPVRILSNEEVAAKYKDLLDGTNVAVPANTVTPSLLKELKKAGVPIMESDTVSYSKKIAETVETAIKNRGKLDTYKNQQQISKVPKEVSNYVLQASDGLIDISEKMVAINGYDVYHEFVEHSNEEDEHAKKQIVLTPESIAAAINAIYSPDYIEAMFVSKNNPTQRQSFIYAKKENGYYVVVEAIGGNDNPNITPKMIVHFTEEKWNEVMAAGITLAEVIHKDKKTLTAALDKELIKRNRVIVAKPQPASTNSTFSAAQVNPTTPTAKSQAETSGTDVNGIAVYDPATESVAPDDTMHSLKSWSESEYVQAREDTVKAIMDATGESRSVVEKYIDDIDSVAKMIADDRARLDYDAAPGRSVFVSNAEYGGSIDCSTLCAKRRIMTGTFQAIQNSLKDAVLTADDVLKLRNMMKDRGYVVNCGLCYVEGSRAQMGVYAKQFIDRFKKHYPDAEWIPTMPDVNTPDGIEQMRLEHPDVYKVYEQFWNNHGKIGEGDSNLFASQQKPKMYQTRTDYKGEILRFFDSDTKVEEKNKNGGIRIQSFSDFEMAHMIDMMQVITDMHRVGLAGQAYTKVPEFAWAFGGTGLKINLSLIANGVDGNGRLIFDDVEGMPHVTAFDIRNTYSDNVGTILVVFDDAQLQAAMDDDRIDFIIPFHRSQWKKAQYGQLGLPSSTKDFTYVQNEKYSVPKYHEFRGRMVKEKAANYMPNRYWDFNISGKENAQRYLEMCFEDGKRPKFYKLLDKHADGRYTLKEDGSTDGYWKLLIDFKMYNNDGVGVPQNPVTANFNMGDTGNALADSHSITQMLKEYEGGHQSFPVAQDVVDDFVKEYEGETMHSRKAESVQEKLDRTVLENDELKAQLQETNRLLKDARKNLDKASFDAWIAGIETKGRVPLRNQLLKTVAKYNNAKLTGVSNEQIADRIIQNLLDLGEHDYAADALTNLLWGTMYDKAAGQTETIENDTREMIREHTAGQKFFVSDGAFTDLVSMAGGRRALNDVYRRVYGFTLVPESEAREKGVQTSFGTAADEILEDMPNVFAGSYYENLAGEGDPFSAAAALYEMQDAMQVIEASPDEVYGAQTVFESAMEEAADFAEDIIRLTPMRTVADEYVARMDELRAGYQGRLQAKQKEIESLRGKVKRRDAAVDRVRADREEKLSAMRQYYMEMRHRDTERRQDTANKQNLRKKLIKDVQWLRDRLENATDQKHIPEALKRVVTPFVAAFAENEAQLDRGLAVFNRTNIDRLLTFYQRLNDENAKNDDNSAEMASLYGLYDEDIADNLTHLKETIDGKRLAELNATELQELDDVIANLRKLVRDVNSAFVNGKRIQFSESCMRLMDETKAKQKDRNSLAYKIKTGADKINIKMAKPVYLFREVIGGEMQKYFDDIREAQNVWAFRMRDAAEMFAKTKEKYHFKDWAGSKNNITVTLSDGTTAVLTKGAVLSIYATHKREMSLIEPSQHLTGGGIVLNDDLLDLQNINDLKKAKKVTDEAIAQTAELIDGKAHPLTMEDIQTIIGTLTDEQKAYADTVVQYLSGPVAGWGNEASMEMHGYKKFGQTYYFPFQSSDLYLRQSIGVADDARIKNKGFTKALTRGANNPVVITDFSEVAAKHIGDMASYSTLAVPLENMNRLLNFKLDRSNGVRAEINETYGKTVNQYMREFLTQMNGGVKKDVTATAVNRMLGRFKRAAVAMNASVMVQQPSAIARAMSMVDPKYFVRSTANFFSYSELEKYSGVAIIKKLGGWDTGTSRSTTDYLLGEYEFFARVADITGKGAEVMDEITWSQIWNAVKRETAHEMGIQYRRKGMSEEFYRRAAARFNDVADYTQVYDSTLARSQLMRSQDTLMKMATAFMAEPTTSYNMLVFSGMKKNGKTINKGAAIGAFICNVILNTALQSLVGAWRDKEDESYWERWFKKLVQGVFGTRENLFTDSEFNLLNMIPFVKDVISLFQGYDVERSDMQPINEIIKPLKKLIEAFSDRDDDEALLDFLQENKDLLVTLVVTVSNLFPVPLKSLYKDVYIGGKTALEHLEDGNYHTTAQHIADIWRQTFEGQWDKNEQLYNAVLNGDQELLDRYTSVSQADIDKYITKETDAMEAKEYAILQKEKDMHKRISEALMQMDERIRKSAEATYEGDIDRADQLAAMIAEDGFSLSDVYHAINLMFKDLYPEEKEYSGKLTEYTLVTNDMLDKAFYDDKPHTVIQMRDRLIEQGKSASTVDTHIGNLIDDDYASGEIDLADAKRMYQDFTNLSDKKITERLQKATVKLYGNDEDVSYDTLRNVYREIGVSDDDISKSMGDAVVNDYVAGKFASKDAAIDEFMKQTGEADKGTASLKFDYEDEKARDETFPLTFSNYKKYVESGLESSGVSADTYSQFLDATKGIDKNTTSAGWESYQAQTAGTKSYYKYTAKQYHFVQAINNTFDTVEQKEAAYKATAAAENWNLSKLKYAPWY